MFRPHMDTPAVQPFSFLRKDLIVEHIHLQVYNIQEHANLG